jgi:hypothetical protein
MPFFIPLKFEIEMAVGLKDGKEPLPFFHDHEEGIA